MYALIFFLLLCSCGKDNKVEESETHQVSTLLIEEKMTQDYVETTAELKPYLVVEVKSGVKGTLKKLHAPEGSWILAGDVMASIEPAKYQSILEDAEQQLKFDQAHLEHLLKKQKRYESLTQDDGISAQELDDLAVQVDKAQALYKKAQIKVRTCNKDLDSCQIKAPIDGWVNKMNIDPGNKINEDQILTTLYNSRVLKLSFTLTEKESASRSLSASHPEIEVISLIHPEMKSTGKIVFYEPELNPETGLRTVWGELANANDLFSPGQLVQVRVHIGTPHPTIKIPQKALEREKGNYTVFVVEEDHTVAKRIVKTGETDQNEIEIVGGLKTGDKVVVQGLHHLKAGMHVKEL